MIFWNSQLAEICWAHLFPTFGFLLEVEIRKLLGPLLVHRQLSRTAKQYRYVTRFMKEADIQTLILKRIG